MGRFNGCAVLDFVVADTATAAGTTDTITSDAIDCINAESVTCIVELGAITSSGTATLQVTHCDTSGGSYADISGATAAAADDDDEKLLIVEVVRPTKRYIKIDCDRATANVVIKSMLAVIKRTTNLPVAQTSAAATAVVVLN